MKKQLLAILAAGALAFSGTQAFAGDSKVATKADKQCSSCEKMNKNDSSTSSPVKPSKADQPGDATSNRNSAQTDNEKTGVSPSKKGAADQTQAPR